MKEDDGSTNGMEEKIETSRVHIGIWVDTNVFRQCQELKSSRNLNWKSFNSFIVLIREVWSLFIGFTKVAFRN